MIEEDVAKVYLGPRRSPGGSGHDHPGSGTRTARQMGRVH